MEPHDAAGSDGDASFEGSTNSWELVRLKGLRHQTTIDEARNSGARSPTPGLSTSPVGLVVSGSGSSSNGSLQGIFLSVDFQPGYMREFH